MNEMTVNETIYGTGKFRYRLVDNWVKLPKGWSIEVTGVAVDKDDNVWTYQRTDHPIAVFDRAGNMIKTWGGPDSFVREHEITISPEGEIWLDDEAAHTVTKYDTEGNKLMQLGTGEPSDTGYIQYGESKFFESLATIQRGAGPFNRPCAISISKKNGDLYVADGYANARVHRFDKNGKLIRSWGEPGTGPSEFRAVHCIVVDDARDRLIVCDRENNRLQFFDLEGNYLYEWTDVHRPTKTALDKDGNIYISELAWRPNHAEIEGTLARVSIFSPEGELLARWGSSREELHDLENSLFLAPHTIAVDSHGDIYVGEVRESKLRGTKVLRKFERIV
jgi:DNA-binding beta-propeller fold protein YncE